MEDARKTGLKNGLRQLTAEQLQIVLDWPYPMVLDTFNYEDGKFCSLSVGIGLPSTISNPSHENVYNELVRLGYNVYNTRGIAGDFYTTNRYDDLVEAVKEVLKEMSTS